MKTFKEWLKNKSTLCESHFETVTRLDWDNNQSQVPVYINPTLSDLYAIGSNRIRGFTPQGSQNVYVWNQDEGMHKEIWQELQKSLPDDAEFHKDQPDICFYLEKGADNKYRLSYSRFTGTAGSEGAEPALTRLMTYTAMKKLAPSIENAQDYQSKHIAMSQTQTQIEPLPKKPLPKEPSPTHYLPGGKKYAPVITRPQGTPVYSREGD